MSQLLTAAELSSLLDILNTPDHPAFAEAITRLTTLDPATLDPATAPALLARVQSTITKLTEESRLTAEELTKLRRGNKALQSYSGNR